MNYLIDADSVIDYLSGRPSVQVRFPQILQDGAAVSGITLIELFTGVYGGRNPRQAERELRAFLRSVKVLALNRRVIDRAARLRTQLLAVKAPITHRAYDLITAATALACELTLVTSNDRDYADITGLKRLDPRTGRRR
ncbi:MAG: type II toxin-antitoxin system VapC family toxin [Dehalococcoidia bacterium]